MLAAVVPLFAASGLFFWVFLFILTLGIVTVLPRTETTAIFFIVQETTTPYRVAALLFLRSKVVVVFIIILKMALPPLHRWLVKMAQGIQIHRFFLLLDSRCPLFYFCSLS
jgi:hypothetical protein